jgi:hypothetical protein
MMAERIKELKKESVIISKMTLIESLEKLALISKNGLDTLIYIHESTHGPIKISDAIKAIRRHAIDIYESENYSIAHDGISKIKDDGDLGEIVYRVKENA